jgi:hypothetical protein
MDAKPASNQPWANPQVRIAAVVVLIIAIVVGLWLGGVFKSSKHKHSLKPVAARIGPYTSDLSGLKAQAQTLKTPIYWAGPQAGYRYEFTRSTLGYLYVRYLPKGVRNGAPGTNFLIVSTYPFTGAYASLKKLAGKKGIKGPNGSIIYVRPKKTNVLMAYPTANYEIEIYNPQPAISLATARSGNVKPVPKR